MPFPTDWCISVVKFKTVAKKWRCKHFCRERVPPSWANTNGHNSNGLRTVMFRFVDVLVCRSFGFWTFQFVDVLDVKVLVC